MSPLGGIHFGLLWSSFFWGFLQDTSASGVANDRPAYQQQNAQSCRRNIITNDVSRLTSKRYQIYRQRLVGSVFHLKWLLVYTMWLCRNDKGGIWKLTLVVGRELKQQWKQAIITNGSFLLTIPKQSTFVLPELSPSLLCPCFSHTAQRIQMLRGGNASGAAALRLYILNHCHTPRNNVTESRHIEVHCEKSNPYS